MVIFETSRPVAYQLLDKLKALVDKVLEERVDQDPTLHPEQRQAADVFRRFCDYAAVQDWDNPRVFARLDEGYELVSRTIMDIIHNRT